MERLNLKELLFSDQTGCSSRDSCFVSFCATAVVSENKTETTDARSNT